MKIIRQLLALTAVLNFILPTVALACGPSYIEPIFQFETSPDIPLQEFARGNIGLIRPGFGRKALFIAYRYASGGSFSGDDQAMLVEALKGTPPETDDISEALRKWVDARKVVAGEEKLPEIYADKNESGYNFFPNCTRSAFETATQVLNDRAATYGVDNPSVREWLKGQDRVFDICSSGSNFPSEAGPDAPAWLKKDRDYQIAAAHFYAMDFDGAVDRFEQIADDDESPWKETADYLIGRTLVRKASFSKDEKNVREIYDAAETHLEGVIRRSGRYRDAAEQLIGLIGYRSRPKERVHQLANKLMTSRNDNLRQDLIDYTWLLDKFENEVIQEVQKKRFEEERKKNSPPGLPESDPDQPSSWEVKQKAIQNGEIISIGFSYSVPNEQYPKWVNLDFKADATDEEIFNKFAEAAGRKLSEEETASILKSKNEALEDRRTYLGASFRFRKQTEKFGHVGSSGGDIDLKLELIPEFIRADDLSDWIFAFQLNDDGVFQHCAKRWRETESLPWLMAAMAKAKNDSPELARIVADAEKISHTSPAYPTIAYHLARLKIAQNKVVEARKLLDEFLASEFDRLPISTQNAFLELRAGLAANIGEYLKFAGRKVVTFDNDGIYGHIRDFLEEEKTWWNKDYQETQEEYIRKTEDEYRGLLPWDDRALFDEHTVDVLNKHFPLDVLAQVTSRPELPEYLRESLVLTVWTRAVVLGRHDVAMKFATEAAKQPEMSEAFRKVLNAKTEFERRNEELWLLIKNPKLSAFVKNGLPSRGENEISSWEDSWWFEPADTDYDTEGNEVSKDLPRPAFLTAAQSALATSERKQIAALGTGEEYVSRRVFEWATKAPRDPRIPEALYVVAVVNLETKYGSGDTEVRDKAIGILDKKYSNSPWTPKAKEEQY